MMIKRIFIVLTVITVNLSAQVNKVDGPMGISKGKHDVQSIIGADNNAFYVYRNEDEKSVVQRYGKASLTKEWETDISFKDKNIEPLDWHRERLTYLKNGKLYVFVPAASKKKAYLMLYVVGTDGKVDGNVKEIYADDDDNVTDTYKKNVIQYQYSISPDSSKILYWYSYFISGKLYAGNGKTITKVVLIDLKTLKRLPAALPDKYETNDILPGNFAVSNDGFIAFDFTYYTSNKAVIRNILNDVPHYAIGIFNPSTSGLKAIEPDFGAGGKIFAGNSGIRFIANNRFFASLILTDYYDGIKRKAQNSGLYIGLFDAAKGTVEKQGFQYFSQGWKDKYMSKDKFNDVDDHWNGKPYEIKYTPIEGGNYIISAFRARQDVRHPLEKNTVLHDGIITKINGTGSIEWTRVLPMDLYIYGNYESHVYLNKKMYYFFDDNAANEKNIDVNNVEVSKDTKSIDDIDGKEVNTICVTYDGNGKAERTIIQNNKEGGLIPLDKVVLTDKNKAIFYFRKGAKEYFSVITLQ